MRSATAARRYARALFALAREGGAVNDVRREVEQLAGLLTESRELREALLTPLHPSAERKAVLRRLAEQGPLCELVRHFMLFLVDRKRLIDFPAIVDEYARLADAASGLVVAQVTSASELDERRRDRLRRALSDRTGQEVRLEVRVDAGLIGGAIAKVGDTVFDGSIRTQLERLRANLTKGS